MNRRERDLRKLCRKYGLVCERSGRMGHFAVTDPSNGRTVATASVSSSDMRGIKNLEADFRKYRTSHPSV